MQSLVERGHGRRRVLCGRVIVSGLRNVNVGIVRLILKQQVELLLRRGKLAPGNQQLGHFQMRSIMVGIDLHGCLKFLEGARPLLEFERRQRHPVVRFRKARVHLDRILVLNGCFAILSLIVIALAAFQVLLLANVRVPRAPCQQPSQHAYRHHRAAKPPSLKFPHVFKPLT